jgi:hypothetical protein
LGEQHSRLQLFNARPKAGSLTSLAPNLSSAERFRDEPPKYVSRQQLVHTAPASIARAHHNSVNQALQLFRRRPQTLTRPKSLLQMNLKSLKSGISHSIRKFARADTHV